MGKLRERILSIFRRRNTEKIVPKQSGITRPDSVERIAARIARQSPAFSEGTIEPLAPEHRERFEKIFGPACIRNEYKHTILLQNNLLSIKLQPGESRVIGEVLKGAYDSNFKHNMVREWDPYATLCDLVAEYERSQDPVARYNSTTTELVETSALKMWKLRGQAVQAGLPHRPVSGSDPVALVDAPLQGRWNPSDPNPAPSPDLDVFKGFGGGTFGGAGAGGEWEPGKPVAFPADSPMGIDAPSTEVAKPEESYSSSSDNSVQADTPAPDPTPSPDPPSQDS